MSHRAEQIMVALLANITGLTTTGTNAQRGRVYALSTAPGLTLVMGADEVADDLRSFTRLVRHLSVEITAHVKTTSQLETDINQIKTEIFAALMADITQGLNFVIQTDLEIDEAPELDAEQDQPTARATMQWRVTYAHSGTSTET